MTSVDDKKNILRIRKKHRFIKVLLSVFILAALSLFAAVLVTGNGKVSLDGFRRLFGVIGGETTAAGFSFESGFNNVFADMNGGFAVASTVGVQVFDGGGNKVYTEIYGMSNPTVFSSGRLCAAYDLGGKVLKVFDTAGVLGTVKTEGGIISASLSEHGYLALCMQESGGYKASVSVYKNGAYDSSKQPPFQWFSGEGYILAAAVSPDEKRLAVLTLTDNGSRIVFFSPDSTEEKGSCTLSGKMALDIRFTDDGRVLAICKDALVSIDINGSSQVFLDYTDKYLAGCSAGTGFTALALSDYMVGDQGRLVTVNDDGKTLGMLQMQRKVISVSARGDYLAVLYDDGFAIYDKNLKECAHDDDTAGTLGTIMRSDGKALLITSHSASVFNAVSG
jgi:hypothetical protein